jgi:heptosyltransferase-2
LFPILVVKVGALGDVLRTTAILPGLARRHPEARVTWVTAPAALDLVRRHPLVAEALPVDPADARALDALGAELETRRFARAISLDDETPLAALAARVAHPALKPGVLCGAYLDAGERRYTPDSAPWFDMGLISVHGKKRADELKKQNRESQPAIYARMLGIEMGEPELPLGEAELGFARRFAERHALSRASRRIGLNTGAGGRWESKKLSVERSVELARALAAAPELCAGRIAFLVMGGPDERQRNDAILGGLARAGLWAVDCGTENPLLEFAALVDLLDLLITSDSLALHVANARSVPVLAFFAPTSAAEIELYGRGEKVESLAADYCSYARDADTSTLTVERLLPAALRALASNRGRAGRRA